MFPSGSSQIFLCIAVIGAVVAEDWISTQSYPRDALTEAPVEDTRETETTTAGVGEAEKRQAGVETSAEPAENETITSGIVTPDEDVTKREAENEPAEKMDEDEKSEQHSGEELSKRDVNDEDNANEVNDEEESLSKRGVDDQEEANSTTPDDQVEDAPDAEGEISRSRRYAASESVGAQRVKRVSRAGSSHKSRPSAINRAHNTNSNVETQQNEEEGEDTEADHEAEPEAEAEADGEGEFE